MRTYHIAFSHDDSPNVPCLNAEETSRLKAIETVLLLYEGKFRAMRGKVSMAVLMLVFLEHLGMSLVAYLLHRA
jgi:hypothetical protein